MVQSSGDASALFHWLLITCERFFMGEQPHRLTKYSISKPQIRSKGKAAFEYLLHKYICTKCKIKNRQEYGSCNYREENV